MSLPPASRKALRSGSAASTACAGLFLGLREIVGEILTAEIPVGLVEHHVGEVAGREAVDERSLDALGLAAGKPQLPADRVRLAARRPAGKDRLAGGVLHARIDLLQRRDLRRGQAFVRFARLAKEARGVEMALPGIIEHAVFAMAGLERRVGHDRELFWRNPAVRSRGESLIGPHSIGQQSRPVIRRRAGDDAVIVLRETLRFHQRFPAAVRTASEIGVRGSFPVIGFDDRLGRRGRLMDRTPAEIHDLLGMAESPARVERTAGRGRCRLPKPRNRPSAPKPSLYRPRIRRSRHCRRPHICRSKPLLAAATPRT